ncbi:porin [Longimicrobium sp.]|uniref:porin n=1 Tax=Longimicrobium sp. TaxID=2029185 RepID=UPI002C26184C|nr:porin [Longimicrobium sp.]HSU13248.1 porin [Longimicrobium sp.]
MNLRNVRIPRLLCAAAALALGAPATLLAQYPTGSLHGRLQGEFRTSDIHTQNADGTDAALNQVVGNEFFIRRAYLEFGAQLASNITGKLEVNFTRRTVNLEDAYVDVGLGRFLSWRVGQEKKPMERQELNSSNSYLTVERGAQINGLKNPNLVSQNNFLVAAGFASHDVGTSLELHGAADARIPVSLRLGVWNGAGKDVSEVNDAKTFGGRLVVSPIRNRLSLGASFMSHDDPITVGGKLAVDSAGRSTAFGVDGEWGNLDRGLHVMADAAFGREGRVGALTPAIAGLRPVPVPAGSTLEPRFTTFHVVGEYRFLLPENGYLWAVGPVFRFDRTNPDTRNTEISSTLLTPGLNVYFSPRTWLMFNYDVVSPGDGLDLGRGAGESVHSFKSMLRIWF